jgi:Xaa-Pro aminopeptidase
VAAPAPLAPPGLAEDLPRRLARIGAELEDLGACCLVAVRDESVTYLTGYTTMTFKMHSRPLVAVVTRAGRLILLVGETEADAVRLRVPGAEVRSYVEMDRVDPGARLPDGRLQFAPAAARGLAELVDALGDGSVAVDGLDAFWPPVGQIARMVPELSERLVDGSGVVWDARLPKSPWELDRMGAAAQVLDDAYRRLIERIAPGQTEREIARAFTICQWEAGAHEVGPLAVVADPSRGLFGAPTDRVWRRDELLYLDGAAIVDGYWSDFCRTVAGRPVAPAEREGYARVCDALGAAASTPTAGRTAADVGAAAAHRLGIDPTAVGFGRFGHGIGLHVPEPPSLHPDDPTLLADGMVLCIEPAVVHAGVNFVAEEEWVVEHGALRRLSPAAPAAIFEL